MKTNFNSDTVELHEQIGDEHILTSIETPMLSTAFDKSDAEKIDEIAEHFQAIMETLGLNFLWTKSSKQTKNCTFRK